MNRLCEIRVTVLKAYKWPGSQNLIVQKWCWHLGSHGAWLTFLSVSQSRALCCTLRLPWELEKLTCGHTAWWPSSLTSLMTVQGNCKAALGFWLDPHLRWAPCAALCTQSKVPLVPNISIWLEASCVLRKPLIRCFFRALLLQMCIQKLIWVAILQGFAAISGHAGNEGKTWSPGDGVENLHLDSQGEWEPCSGSGAKLLHPQAERETARVSLPQGMHVPYIPLLTAS